MALGAGAPERARTALDRTPGRKSKAVDPRRSDPPYEFVSRNARAPVIQIVDPNYTVLAKIAKSRLPSGFPQ